MSVVPESAATIAQLAAQDQHCLGPKALSAPKLLVELRGLEPLTPTLPADCSNIRRRSLAYETPTA